MPQRNYRNFLITLEKNIVNLAGKKGKLWLASLPKVIAELSAFWSLTQVKPVTNMSWNYVASAVQYHKFPVVLKISWDGQLINAEYLALKHFNGRGAIQVLDKHEEYNALLLVQAIPGDSLKLLLMQEQENTIRAYAEVIKQLKSNNLMSMHGFEHVREWCNALDNINDPRIEKHLVEKAKLLRTYLLNSAEQEHLCHGDLHLNNIIQMENRWLAIDPKGVIAETAFEAAAFDLLTRAEMQDTAVMATKINCRVKVLANALNIKAERLFAWLFLRVLISAQWFIEDNGDPSEMLFLAAQLYPLVPLGD